MSYDHDFEPGVYRVCRRCGEEWHGPAGSVSEKRMARLKPLPQLNADRAQFVIDLTALKARAGQLGMYRTMQSMDAATNAAGWELADLMTGRQADHLAKLAEKEEG